MVRHSDDRTDEAPSQKAPMSLTLFNPAALFNLLAEMFGPLRIAVWLIWPFVGLGTYAALYNWYQTEAHIDRIFLTLSFFQSLAISILTANLFSKIMLGTTMAWYGIAPQVFGIRLLFGVIPRFYVYKRAVRQLSFDHQRACYAAPLLTKLAMFGIGMVLWTILRRSGSGAADLFLVLSVTGLAAFIFTANPLWPADGYNWLSARLERPKLRRDSLRLSRIVLSGQKRPEGMRAGEVAALLMFASLSVAFTAVLIFLVLQTIAFTLEEQLRGTGVVIFCVIIALFAMFVVSLRVNRQRTS